MVFSMQYSLMKFIYKKSCISNFETQNKLLSLLCKVNNFNPMESSVLEPFPILRLRPGISFFLVREHIYRKNLSVRASSTHEILNRYNPIFIQKIANLPDKFPVILFRINM